MKQSCLLILLLSSIFANAQQPNRYDIVIDEVMADPAPQVGLPGNEWIELKNVSAQAFNLQGWKLSDPASSSGPMPNYILKPDSFVIICTASAQAAMAVFGSVITVTGFPSLDNDGDQLTITSAQGKTIHSVRYDISWYGNELKKDGGWTLEMIDTKNPCVGRDNWKASANASGGTPGHVNSVQNNNTDQSGPSLIKAYATDSINIVLVFDEPLDSLKAAAISNYFISDGIALPLNALPTAPLFDRVNLKLQTALLRNKIYTVTVKQISDCAGNPVGTSNTARVGLSSAATAFDVVINEILFNPWPNGTDYVELYNRSDKIIDLKQLFIANRNNAAVISNIQQINNESSLLFPGDMIAITADPVLVKAQYLVLHPEALIGLTSMPSFNDDKGDVILLNAQGEIIDELKYDEHWHFKLIANTEGVALERIDYNALTQNENNWHSAASSAGYGTPTYKNSQSISGAQPKGNVYVVPEIISPDNDGRDDFATVYYEFPEPGYVANITVFDAAGRRVRYLQQSALCGLKGNYRWDGLGENNQRLPIGIYIIFTEVFNLNGKTKQYKQPIVLAR